MSQYFYTLVLVFIEKDMRRERHEGFKKEEFLSSIIYKD